jgi:hypothetical protein
MRFTGGGGIRSISALRVSACELELEDDMTVNVVIVVGIVGIVGLGS